MESLNLRVDDLILHQTRQHYLSVLDGSLGEKLTRRWPQTVDDLTGDTVESYGETPATLKFQKRSKLILDSATGSAKTLGGKSEYLHSEGSSRVHIHFDIDITKTVGDVTSALDSRLRCIEDHAQIWLSWHKLYVARYNDRPRGQCLLPFTSAAEAGCPIHDAIIRTW